MEIELLKNICLGIPLMFICTFFYVHFLLGISKIFNGIIKVFLSMVLYLFFAVIVALPIFYLISNNQPAVQESTYILILILLSYFLIMAPSLYYIGKVKIKELRLAGYFHERK